MNTIVTTAIVLSRTDFQEADRIVTLLTPNYGKIRVMARGVRKVSSKMAGGIELFSISQVSYLHGRGDINTLISARLQVHYDKIVKDLKRTMAGYDFIKKLNSLTEDVAEAGYFELLKQILGGLNNSQIPLEVLEFWFDMEILRLGGCTPNLLKDIEGKPLLEKKLYRFDMESMAFKLDSAGQLCSDHIKIMRLACLAKKPVIVANIAGIEKLLPQLNATLKSIVSYIQ